MENIYKSIIDCITNTFNKLMKLISEDYEPKIDDLKSISFPIIHTDLLTGCLICQLLTILL
jgi:hypothetical protein